MGPHQEYGNGSIPNGIELILGGHTVTGDCEAAIGRCNSLSHKGEAVSRQQSADGCQQKVQTEHQGGLVLDYVICHMITNAY